MTADYARSDDELLARCDRARSTTGGPGGQHAARHRTAVRLVHRATGLAVEADESRDGRRNLARALDRLRLRLAAVCRGESDPSWLAARRRGDRLPITPRAAGYHLVAAVLLDALAAAAGSLAAAATACGVTTTQVARALRAHPEIRRAADAIRAEHGLGPVR